MDRIKPTPLNTTTQMPEETDVEVVFSSRDLETLRKRAKQYGVPLETVISNGLELYAQILGKAHDDPRVSATLVFERHDPDGAFDREIVLIYEAATVQ